MTPHKVQYRSEHDAEAASRNIEFWHGERLYSYYCEWCDHWHLTSKEPT
jgi:hypothetical protein